MENREKTSCSKKSTFSDRLEMIFFWKPISKLVIWQIFRKFGHSLTDWHRLKDSVWSSYRHFFKYWPFPVKVVPFSLILTKSYNSNTHFGAFFMLYLNQITKLKKYFFWPYQTIPWMTHERGRRANSKYFFHFLAKSPMTSGICFLRVEGL